MSNRSPGRLSGSKMINAHSKIGKYQVGQRSDRGWMRRKVGKEDGEAALVVVWSAGEVKLASYYGNHEG